MQFNQANNKIRTIFDRLHANDAELQSKTNDELLLQFFKTSIKPIFVLDETAWISKKPTRIDSGKTSTERGTLLAEKLSISLNQDFQIPDFLLPYIDVLTFVKTPPDTTVKTYFPYTSSLLTGVTMRIKTDGDIVYQGEVLQGLQWFDLEELDTNLIPLANTKRIYNVVLRYTDGVDDWRITGRLWYLNVEVPNGTGCSGNPDDQWDSFRIRAFTGDIGSQPYAEKETADNYGIITSLTTSTVQGIGNLVQIRSIVGGSGCEVQVTENPSTSHSVSIFSGANRTQLYIDGLIEKKISGLFVPQGLGANYYDLTSFNAPSFDSVEFLGYVPHYTNDTDGYITTNGGVLDLSLTNFPEAIGYTITLEKNPDGFPTGIAETENMGGFSGMSTRKDLTFFKIAENDQNTFSFYRMKFQTDVTIMSPALLDYATEYIRFQNSTYTDNGSTYSRTSNEVDLKTERTYTSINQDVQYKLMLVIKNPLNYQEIRKYDTSQ